MSKNTFKIELIFYPFLLILLLWIVYWGEFYMPFDLIQLGILPRTFSGLIGVIFSPLLHSTNDINHIVNNSIPLFILTLTLLYYYRKVAFNVFFLSWILSGILTWVLAKNTGSYHIGISSILYSLVCFLFFSGVIQRKKQLQAVSLLIVFLYGSMFWGIFPMEEKVSWEGHLGGSIAGIFLALIYNDAPEVTTLKSSQKQNLSSSESVQKSLENLKESYKVNSSSAINYSYTTDQAKD
jgi:membrane associated rhomboid family serine protease